MLNKKDPLIGAVQQVMQQSNAEREATRIVNEAFGIEDRKALPHEYQAEWDAVYKTVLTEGVEALDEASLPKPPTSVKAVKALGMDERRARAKAHKAEAKKHKNVYDTHYERGSHGTQTAQKALDRYTHHNDMADRYLNPSSHFQNEKNREKDFSDGGVKVYNEAKIDHTNKRKLDVAPLRAMGEDLEAIQEEIAYNLAEQAEYVYENYGEEGLVEFFESLTEEQLEILSLYESNFWKDTNIGRGMAAAGKWLSGSGGGSGDGYSGAKETYKNTTPGGAWAGTTNTNATAKKEPKTNAGISNLNATAGQQSGQGTSGPNRGLGTSPAAPGKATIPVPKPKPQNTATPPAASKDASTNKATPPAAKSTNTATPPATKKIKRVAPSDMGSGGKQERGSSLGVTTGTTTGTTATNRPSRSLSKTMRDNPVASFRKAPKATVGAALRKPGAARNALKDKGVTRAGVARGIGNARSGKGSFGGGNRAGRGGEGRGGRGSLKEQIQNIVAQKIMEAEGSAAGMSYDKNSPTINSLRNKMYGSNPTPRTVQTGTQKIDTSAISPVVGSTTVAPRGPDTQALSNTARRASSGDVAPGSQKGANRVGAVIRTNAERIASRTGQNKSFDASYNAAAGTNPRNTALDQPNSQSPMAKAIANKGVPTNMSGGGGDYRKAQASPIKVSDTEVMNDPKFKKGLSSVGGTQAAKKIQVGQRVAGLGRMNKGDTIMSRVRTDIAARKNVGRES